MVQADNGGGGGPTLDPKAHANERELFKIFGFEYWSVDWAANDWLTSAARIRSVAKDVRTTITQLESGDGTKDNPAWTGPSAVAACASMEQLAKSLDTRASEIDKARLGMEQVTKDSSWAREQWYARVYPIKTTLDERDYQRISGPDGVDHARMAQDEQALYAKRDAEAKKILTELNQRIATSTASMPVDYVPPQDPYSGSAAGGGTGGGGGSTTPRSVGDVRGPKGGGTGLEPVRPPVGPIVDPIPPDRPICVLPPPILPETPDCELPPPEPPVIDNGGTDVISMDGSGTGTTHIPSTGGTGGVSTGHPGVGGVSAGGAGSLGALGMGALGGRGVPGLGAAGRGVSAVGAGSGRAGTRGPGSSIRGASGTGKYGTPLVGGQGGRGGGSKGVGAGAGGRSAAAGARGTGVAGAPGRSGERAGAAGKGGAVGAGSGAARGGKGKDRSQVTGVDRLTTEDEETWFEGAEESSPSVWE